MYKLTVVFVNWVSVSGLPTFNRCAVIAVLAHGTTITGIAYAQTQQSGVVDDVTYAAILEAANNSNSIAQYNLWVLGGRSEDQAQIQQAETWLRKASQGGDPIAQLAYGSSLYDQATDGRTQYNLLEKAIAWIALAAKQNLVEAQYNLGWIGIHTKGSSLSQAEGEKWIERAAQLGNVTAMKGLALYREGSIDSMPALQSVSHSVREFASRSPQYVETTTPVYADKQLRVALGSIPAGSKMDILEQSAQRTRIRLQQGLIGWIQSDEVFHLGTSATVIGLQGTLFVSPDSNSPKLMTVIKDEVLDLTGQTDGWVQVLSPLRFSAWVKSAALQPTKKIEVLSNQIVLEANSETEAESVSDLDPSEQDDAMKLYRLSKNTLGLASPNQTARPLGVLEFAEDIEVVNLTNDFARLSQKTQLIAWVFGKYLTVVEGQGVINGDNVRVRAEPNTGDGARILGKFNKGKTFTVLEELQGWYKVVMSVNKPIWVAKSVLQL